MWRYFLLLGVLATSPAIGRCDAVQFMVPPGDTGVVYTQAFVPGFTSDALNGTALTGQVLSLDAVLSDDVLARFLNCETECGVSLAIFTNAPFTFVEFAGPSTGFYLNANGNQFGGTQFLGRAGGNNGAIFVGLSGLPKPNVDISGGYFNIALPDTGFLITGLEIDFNLDFPPHTVEFGTAEQLPEPSTFGVTAMGLLMLFAWRKGWRQHWT